MPKQTKGDWFLATQLTYVSIDQDVRAMVSLGDYNGWLPLVHHASYSNEALGVCEHVDGNAIALRVDDNQLSCPLHIACKYSYVDTTGVVQVLRS